MSEIIKGLLVKFERYEWMNIIMPGIFFVTLMKIAGVGSSFLSGAASITGIVIVSGMIASRVGSTIVECVVKKIEPFAPYRDFIDWERSCPEKAAMLTTNLNMFRSLTGVSFMLILVLGGRLLIRRIAIEVGASYPSIDVYVLVGCAALVGIFGCSYRRQIRFIKARVLKNKKRGK